MKKNSTIVLLFAVLSIIVFGNVVFKRWDAHAVESTETMELRAMPEEVPMHESTDGAVIKQKSDYVLPYPGILPDHPVYFLKDFRDKIIEMLIVDPERKNEFYLLQSDKFLNAAQSLLDKNQSEKAKAVLVKSADKMAIAVSELSGMKTNGRQISAGSIERMTKAIEKHFEVLDEMSSKIDTADTISSLQKAEEELKKLQ